MIGAIKSGWRGEMRLWKAFWVMGFAIPLVIALVAILLMIIPVVGWIIGAVLLFLLIPYNYVWIPVAWWRCAWNAGAKVWGYIVRFFVVLYIIGILFGVFFMVAGGGLMMVTMMMGGSGSMMGDFEKQMQQMEQEGGFDAGGFDAGSFDAGGFDPNASQSTGDAELDAAMKELDASMKELNDMQKAFEQGVTVPEGAQEEYVPFANDPEMEATMQELERLESELDALGADLESSGAEIDAALRAPVSPVIDAPLNVPATAAVPAVPASDTLAVSQELLTLCTEKFEQSYRDRGFDPAQYPDQKTDYIQNCAKHVQKNTDAITGGAQ